MQKPDFLCIGAQKGGTTWLYHVLRENPDVWLGPFKEYQFFNALFVKGDTWVGWHVRTAVQNAIRYSIADVRGNNFDLDYLRYLTNIADEKTMFTEDWYRYIFSRGGEKVKGDITPGYCSIPAEGVDYVLRTQGALPIIFLIRDPVSRTLSQLRMNISRSKSGPPTTREQWDKLIANAEVAVRSNYRSAIDTWLARYPERKMLFIPYGDIARDPTEVLRQIERHIGVGAHQTYAKAAERVHEGKKVEMPKYVTEMIRQQSKPQYDYLEQTLGKAFVKRI
jgi:hypothetical protein